MEKRKWRIRERRFSSLLLPLTLRSLHRHSIGAPLPSLPSFLHQTCVAPPVLPSFHLRCATSALRLFPCVAPPLRPPFYLTCYCHHQESDGLRCWRGFVVGEKSEGEAYLYGIQEAIQFMLEGTVYSLERSYDVFLPSKLPEDDFEVFQL